MKRLKLTLLLATFALATSFAYAQTTDSTTVSTESFPNVFVGKNITAGKQSKDSILESPFITARDPNNEIQWNVLSYKVTFVTNGRESAPITVKGERFSEQVIAKIKSAPSGTIIEISEIRIQSIVGMKTIVRPIVIRIR